MPLKRTGVPSERITPYPRAVPGAPAAPAAPAGPCGPGAPWGPAGSCPAAKSAAANDPLRTFAPVTELPASLELVTAPLTMSRERTFAAA